MFHRPHPKDSRHLCITFSIISGLLFFLFSSPVNAGTDDSLAYLKSLGIEDLLDTEVTSVSKKAEKLTDVAAAVFVITAEDIRRAGARTIAEALRMAPGIQVSRVDNDKWIVTARGFSDTFSNKLLVLIDGRSVYTPLFSGVFWDAQDTVMEDIDRIEVIRGPGATMWGANAVNGVINIITKPSQQTQGALITTGAGSYNDYEIAARYGARLNADAAWRIYAKGFQNKAFEPDYGDTLDADWKAIRAGFRMDLDLSAEDSLTFQGDIYDGRSSIMLDLPSTFTAPAPGPRAYASEYSGANLVARWRRAYGSGSDTTLQLYYDRTDRDIYVLSEVRDTVDLDFQHRFNPTDRQEIVWGAGYRHTSDDTGAGYNASIHPESRADQLFSAFAQNEITLLPDTWWLTIGSKFEHNDYTGYEIQPSLRLRWKPRPNQTAWAAVSRAVRTPSRGERGLRSNQDVVTVPQPDPPYGATTYLAAYFGQDGFDSETLTAYELGYRWQPDRRLSMDLATFYHDYNDLRSIEADPEDVFVELAPPPPHIVTPVYIGNEVEGESFGLELTANWQPLTFWRLTANYSWLRVLLQSTDATPSVSERSAGQSPINQIQFRSTLDLPRGWSFDTELYYVDALDSMDIASYTRLDLRLGWQPGPNWELSLNAENILGKDHLEYGESNDIVPALIPRLYYIQVALRY